MENKGVFRFNEDTWKDKMYNIKNYSGCIIIHLQISKCFTKLYIVRNE